MVLLADTCVAIDYIETDVSVLTLICEHFAPLVIPSPVLEEFNAGGEIAIDRSYCQALGLTVLEPELDDDLKVVARTERGPSDTDWYCLSMSQRLGYTCLTNDTALIKACENNGVTTMRSLRPLLELVKRGVLAKSKAKKLAGEMVENGARIASRHLTEFHRLVDAGLEVKPRLGVMGQPKKKPG